jgi:hypothetical protein
MKKLIFLVKRKPGTTAQEFREHYENFHVPLAQKHISHLLVGYHRNYPTTAWRVPGGPDNEEVTEPFDFGYDCITELRLRDQSADEMLRIFTSPGVGELFVEDERRFVARKAMIKLECDET